MTTVQVLLACRELLCLPSAALAALLQHELAHNAALIKSELAPLAASCLESEADRARHQMQLGPRLAQPACEQELADLRAREDKRWKQELVAGAGLLRRLADAVPAAVQASEQRLVGFTQQVAQLVSAFPAMEDLAPASAGDTSLEAVPPLNLMQLERWKLAQEDVDGMSFGETLGGRALAQASATVQRLPLGAQDLGWSAEHEQLTQRGLTASGQEVAGAGPSLEVAPSSAAKDIKRGPKAATPAAGKAQPVAAPDARDPVTIVGVDAPSFRAAVRAHHAAATMLQRGSAEQLQRALQGLVAGLEKALAWRDTWQAMLRHLEPARAPERAGTQ